MKLIFVSNYLNHHQLPFCMAMIKQLGEGEFKFIATTPFNQARLNSGYADLNTAFDWVIRSYEDDGQMEEARLFVREADVALLLPECTEFSDIRARERKLTFWTSERILKKGYWWRFTPPKILRTYSWFLKYKHKPFYILCCSAFAAYDFVLSGFPEGRYFKWSYFTEIPPSRPVKTQRVYPRILWVGRMIPWKNPSDAVEAAALLAAKGLRFHLDLVGDGPEREKVSALVAEKRLEAFVELHGSLSNNEVRKMMEDADIFVASSDRNEGWGAVINEALSSSCAVVASEAMGATRFLIEDCVNGVIYPCGDIAELAKKLELLITDVDRRTELQIGAYKSMAEYWNADEAARRLISLSAALASGEECPYLSGPCSPAPLLRQA
jgi:glycosyltransferase involved in cell wall biosynthesis